MGEVEPVLGPHDDSAVSQPNIDWRRSHMAMAARMGWKVTSACPSRPTKAVSQAEGRDMAKARGVEHVIHKLDGEIQARNTYRRSRDPRRSNG